MNIYEAIAHLASRPGNIIKNENGCHYTLLGDFSGMVWFATRDPSHTNNWEDAECIEGYAFEVVR